MLRKIIIIGIVLATISFLAFKIFNTANKKNSTEKATATLPAFTFYNLQNQPVNNGSLQKSKSTVFIYFNTGCEHCQYETEQILKNEKQLHHSQVLMISRQPARELMAFDTAHELSSYPFIRLLRDSANSFHETFGTAMVPSIFIYNREQKLVKKYLGETKIENLIQAVHE